MCHSLSHTVCRHCDLVVEIPALKDRQAVYCPRCDGRLFVHHKSSPKYAVAYAISALFMLILALSFSFVEININGILRTMSIFGLPQAIIHENYNSLAVVFVLGVLFFPAMCLMITILTCSNISTFLSTNIRCQLLRIQQTVSLWCMVEIFLIGLFVSFVKIISYGEISLKESFLPFCLFVFFYIKSMNKLDRIQLWHHLLPPPTLDQPLIAGQNAMQQNLRLCDCCHAILPLKRRVCPRCGVKGFARTQNSLTWTLSLLITAIILYVPANILSIMDSFSLGERYPSNIMAGVIFMWQSGSYPIAAIIFIASIMIPVLKMFALIWLYFYSKSTKPTSKENCIRMQWIYDMVELVGRWSMIDVFVVMVVSTLIQVGILMNVIPAIGVVLFMLVVIMTMIAAYKFDSRLIWDRLESSKAAVITK